MKRTLSTVILFIIPLTFFGQVQKEKEEKTEVYEVFKIKSEYFKGEERTFKVALPHDYSADKKYPVIYTLDGSSMFEMVASYTKYLGNQTVVDGEDYATNVIPPSIVVGIFHNNRGIETEPNFTGLAMKEGPENLKSHIVNEIVPYINKNYAVSGYNSIIGHSNTAYFTTRLLFEPEIPFKGIIALSLVKGDETFNEKLVQTLQTNFDKVFFVGAGDKDNEFNELAQRIKSDVSSSNVAVKNYISNHTDLPAAALSDGIQHLFYKYRNFGRFPELSLEKDFDVSNYIGIYKQTIKADYGIETTMLPDDFGYFVVETVNSGNVTGFEKLLAYEKEVNNYEYPNIMKFHYRRDLKDLKEAKNLAYKILSNENGNDYRFLAGQIDVFTDFFINDLGSPNEAISFLEKAKKRFPDYTLNFNYFIAKTSIEEDVQKKKGKASLEYCRKNFKANRYFELADLGRLEMK
ncbi:alpha/beta hydrolase [Roseivirga misakiensis]|uniref:Esterase n=1 Tax=Roseivirga misakiensis TaxID=1563681 RepID=A0A1E5T0R2_9BACT|nr:alpha/beta hydrolase-fold protein [Roseivirga misakiensis]OEK04951.1 hypothetical protein BFP71_16095 [Roseivirga misakiensis]